MYIYIHTYILHIYMYINNMFSSEAILKQHPALQKLLSCARHHTLNGVQTIQGSGIHSEFRSQQIIQALGPS